MTERPVALITLANGYVGPPLARLLAASGHNLVLQVAGGAQLDTMVADSDTDALVTELVALGATVETVTGVDLTTAAGNQVVVDAAVSRFGRLDAACFVTGSIITGRFLASTGAQWDKLKSVNLDMVYYALASCPAADGRRRARSDRRVHQRDGGPTGADGVAVRGDSRGANALVRAVGLEHAKFGVTVNAVGTNYMDFPRLPGRDRS